MNDDRPYMTCRELIDFLYLYLENELPNDRRAEFDRHLGVCDPCQDYIRQYELSIRLAKDAFADSEVPAEEAAPEALVRAVLASRSGS